MAFIDDFFASFNINDFPGAIEFLRNNPADEIEVNSEKVNRVEFKKALKNKLAEFAREIGAKADVFLRLDKVESEADFFNVFNQIKCLYVWLRPGLALMLFWLDKYLPGWLLQLS